MLAALQRTAFIVHPAMGTRPLVCCVQTVIFRSSGVQAARRKCMNYIISTRFTQGLQQFIIRDAEWFARVTSLNFPTVEIGRPIRYNSALANFRGAGFQRTKARETRWSAMRMHTGHLVSLQLGPRLGHCRADAFQLSVPPARKKHQKRTDRRIPEGTQVPSQVTAAGESGRVAYQHSQQAQECAKASFDHCCLPNAGYALEMS